MKEFAHAIRSHWSTENNLHWLLDVIFREDAERARKDNLPLNMNVLKKAALPLLNKARYGRVSKRIIRFRAEIAPQIMLNVLFDLKK